MLSPRSRFVFTALESDSSKRVSLGANWNIDVNEVRSFLANASREETTTRASTNLKDLTESGAAR